jgi:hypothetical protein
MQSLVGKLGEAEIWGALRLGDTRRLTKLSSKWKHWPLREHVACPVPQLQCGLGLFEELVAYV